MTKLKLCVCLPLMLLLAACAEKGPRLVPVKGRLTLNGQPLPGKHIQFEPIEGTAGLGGGANTDAEGNYEVIAIVGGSTVDQMGVPAGKYKVTVTEPMFPIDMELKVQGQSSEADIAIGLPTESPKKKRSKVAIPSQYGAIESTPLEVTVPPEGGNINLDLKSEN